ncbi:hypothetical protein AAG570_004834 [Ranatra chinensis]|uniref:Reverse transcriptase domain-containing protein n=1 Tax=Ranatra chinensis TaxID=642074 RepID=A0ABD0YH07_9HEMI
MAWIRALVSVSEDSGRGEDVRGTNIRGEDFRGEERGVTGGGRLEGRVNGARARRRREYAAIQELWKKDRAAAVQRVLGNRGADWNHSMSEIEEFWAGVMEEPSAPWDGGRVNSVENNLEGGEGLWAPITREEINSSEPGNKAAAGPDQIRPVDWRGVPTVARALFYNIIIACGRMPRELLEGRTTLIPKGGNQTGPGDYRPITVASVVTRQFHRILSCRLAMAIRHVPEQRGFLRGRDGVAESVYLLDRLLRDRNSRKKGLHMAIVDVRKAFDSVSHDALIRVMAERHLDEGFQQYLRSLYSVMETRISRGAERSRVISCRRGVRQGDPLSPLLFNCVMDHALGKLNSDVGYSYEGAVIKALAYADDVILIASSREGLQDNLERLSGGLGECGLQVNPAKCLTLSVISAGKAKTSKVVRGDFRVGNETLPSLGVDGAWRYLGVRFNLFGVMRPGRELLGQLGKVADAPLKPQQRLEMARGHLIPGVLHEFVLGKPDRQGLLSLDVMVRGLVRKWCHLPHDSANAFIHAPVKEGGLGIPELAKVIPALRRRRLTMVRSGLNREGVGEEVSAVELGEARQAPSGVRRELSGRLHTSVDGTELSEASGAFASTAWVRARADELSGREFVQFIRIRGGALPSRVRLDRARLNGIRGRRCRGGCDSEETAAHVVQSCPLSRGGRSLRHDAVVTLMAEAFRRRGFAVRTEVLVQMGARALKPDILVKREGTAGVLDVQVVSGAGFLKEVNSQKRAKYSEPSFLQAAAEALGTTEASIKVVPLTLTWKGIWCRESVTGLRQLGITGDVLNWAVERVLRGTSISWNRWWTRVRRGERAHEDGRRREPP